MAIKKYIMRLLSGLFFGMSISHHFYTRLKWDFG